VSFRAAYLIPVYNGQRDFDDTIRSLSSTSVPCAVIVVDDGSHNPIVVGNYGPSLDVKLIRFPQNKGIVAAMNAGLNFALEAGYEFVARIDAGDFAAPRRLELQIEYMDAHPNCMLVGSDAEFRDETGAYCFNYEPPRDPVALSNGLHERPWLLHPSVMYRTSVLRDVGLYTEKYVAAEDYELFLRIAQSHEVGVVPEPLIVYVVRRGGISGSKVRAQAMSRLRIQLRYFAWANWKSYYGVLRTAVTLLLPQALKAALKSRVLYARRNPENTSTRIEMESSL
jgi:glycosyltransferase involved in cell wall biosynthesis